MSMKQRSGSRDEMRERERESGMIVSEKSKTNVVTIVKG